VPNWFLSLSATQQQDWIKCNRESFNWGMFCKNLPGKRNKLQILQKEKTCFAGFAEYFLGNATNEYRFQMITGARTGNICRGKLTGKTKTEKCKTKEMRTIEYYRK
jgi:hypothetical protein